MIIASLGWVLILPLIFTYREMTKWQMRCLVAEEKAKQVDKLEEIEQELMDLKLAKQEIEATLQEKSRGYEEKLKLLEETKEKLSHHFKAISLEAMEKYQKRSDEDQKKREENIEKILQPVKQSLGKLDDQMRGIEKERQGEKEALKEHLKQLVDSERHLRKETESLAKSLRKPDIRGLWGEMQLKRVVELSGMVNYCDFFEQQTKQDEGQRLRPDLLIRMPGDRSVVVDAKAPFEAFLEANHTEDIDKKENRLAAHARHLRMHIQALGKKSYYEQFQPSPEFVILFLPAEIFFSAALEYDPTLIEYGASQGVILATPTTLIGLLRSIAYGWKQDRFSKNAEEIKQLGHELYKRLGDMSKHWVNVGKSIGSAVDHYNKAIGSLERRVLSSARKFQELGAANEEVEISSIEQVDKIPKKLLMSDTNDVVVD